MADNRLQNQEQTYRSASRAFDYFVTGLSALLFLATAHFFETGESPVLRVLDAAAIVLFAMAIVAGLQKLEYFVAVLGTDYSIALTETNRTKLTVRELTALLRDLNQTVEHLSNVASVVHRLRKWFLVLGIFALTTSQVLRLILTS